jgi:cytochrome c peroxidase
MVLLPIANHVEMGVFDFDIIIKKMEASPYYEDLFEKAFGDGQITTRRISIALATFLQTIRTDNTKLDRAARGEVELSPLELFGQQLFNTTYDCNSCHQVQSPSGYLMGGGFANIGLDETYTDIGLEGTTGMPSHNGSFKIPSLRNVALTAPYMHDGRFASLDSVMNHYSEGLKSNPNLDFRLRDSLGQPLTLKISEPEKRAIIAFLQTLTDYTMITDPKFSDPFKPY